MDKKSVDIWGSISGDDGVPWEIFKEHVENKRNLAAKGIQRKPQERRDRRGLERNLLIFPSSRKRRGK